MTDTLLLWNARLIDGRGGPPVEAATIAVDVGDGRIASIGTARGDPPVDAIDLAGLTLLPGLIDAHAHVSSDTERSPGFGLPPLKHGAEPPSKDLRYFVLANMARAFLRAGITTVRDVGSYDNEAIVLRHALELGLVDGPRLLSCGRILTATSPGARIFGTMYREADGPWEMRKAVREQIRDGADYIKIMATGARSVEREDPEPAQMTLEEVAAVVDEAHRMGYRVAAHAEGLPGARNAIDAGVDTVEHGLSLHRAPELLDAMAERGIVLVPTLSTFYDLAERFAADFAPRLVEQAKRQAEDAALTLIAAQAAGVTLAMGYDSGPPGASANELVRMAEAGLGAAAAIRAATEGSATALGLDGGRHRRARPDRRPAGRRRRPARRSGDPARTRADQAGSPGRTRRRRHPVRPVRHPTVSEPRQLREGALLWQPTEAFRAASTMTDYMDWLERERGLRFADYGALWRWSVDDLEAFWGSVVDYYRIPLRGTWDRVLGARDDARGPLVRGRRAQLRRGPARPARGRPPGVPVPVGAARAPRGQRRRVARRGRGGGGRSAAPRCRSR